MSRNSQHLYSVYNSNIRLRLEHSECHLRFQVHYVRKGIAVLVLEMLWKNEKLIKVDVEFWAD